MKRRFLLVTACAAVGSLSGCLSRFSSPPLSESTIEACEVAYIEESVFDDDNPPTIDASIESVERHDGEYHQYEVKSQWMTSAIDVFEIELRPADGESPEDAPSTNDEPFADLEAFHETLTSIVDSGDEEFLESDHEEHGAVRDALVEAFRITEDGGADGKEFSLDHDGERVDVSLLVEEIHGDGEEEATYYASEDDVYRVGDHDGTIDDGIPMEC